MPDVVGLDGMAARRALEQAGLAVEIRDSPAPPDLLSAVVPSTQSPAAGTVVPPGTVVALHFELADGAVRRADRRRRPRAGTSRAGSLTSPRERPSRP